MKILRSNYIKIGIFVLSAIVTLFVVYTLGKPINYPWPLEIDINHPQKVALDKYNNIRALIDKDHARVSLYDSDEKIFRTYEYSQITDKPVNYYNIAYENDLFYLHRVTVNISNGYLSSEQIVCYNIVDESETLIYEINYDEYKDQVKHPKILDMKAENGYLEVLKLSETMDKHIQLMNLGNETTEIIKEYSISTSNNNVYSASYNGSCGKLVYNTFNGEVFELDNANNSKLLNKDRNFLRCQLCLLDNGQFYITELMDECLYKYTDNKFELIENNILINSFARQENSIVICEGLSNSIKFYYNDNNFNLDQNTEEVKSVSSLPYSLILIITTLVTWLAYLYVFAFLIYLLVIVVKRIIKDNDSKTKLLIVSGVILVVSIVFVCCYYSYYLFMQAQETHYSQLKIACQEYINSSEKQLQHNSNTNSSTISQSRDLYTNAKSVIEAFSMGGSEINLDIILNLELPKFKQKQATSLDIYEGQEIYDDLENPNYTNHDFKFITAMLHSGQGNYLFAAKGLYANNQLLALVCCYSLNSNLILLYSMFCIVLIVSLLVIAGSLILFFMELSSLLINLKTSIVEKRKGNHKNTDFYGVRILIFLNYFTYSLDIALVVLVVQDMLSNKNFADISLLLSLPISLYFFGSFVGCFSAGLLAKRFKAKIYIITFAFLFFASEIATVFSVLHSNYFIFCVFKVFCGIFQSTIFNSVGFIQYRANDPKVQSLLANDQSLASVSAGALATMCAGNIANIFGNHCIYVLGAVFCILFVAFALWFIPKNIYYRSNQNKPQATSSYKYVIKFMLSPKMIIIIICLCVVSVLVNQYASVLYPLFADAASLDKGQIGNITMFAVVICFLINSIFKKKIASTNQRTLLIVAFFLMSFAFLCFALNDTILWASFTLIFVTFGYRMCSSLLKTLWVPLAVEEKMDQSQIYTITQTLKSLSSIATPTILSSLLIFGNTQAAFILGIITLTSLILFCIIMRSKKKTSGALLKR